MAFRTQDDYNCYLTGQLPGAFKGSTPEVNIGTITSKLVNVGSVDAAEGEPGNLFVNGVPTLAIDLGGGFNFSVATVSQASKALMMVGAKVMTRSTTSAAADCHGPLELLRIAPGQLNIRTPSAQPNLPSE